MKTKNLVIVESPNKIASIQKYLGDSCIVVASSGHIVDLAKGGRFGIGVNPFNGFKTHYTLIPEKLPYLDTMINSAIECDKIIICTDPDIEGHAIGWHIAEKLKHLNKPIVRAEFHEITEEGIRKGMKSQHPLDKKKFDAQETRRVLDRIVGFTVSPFLSSLYGKNLSAGRVQSVATRMIIEKDDKIKSFEPEEYWNISAKLIGGNGQTCIAKLQADIADSIEAEKVKNILLEDYKSTTFKVNSIQRKIKKELPPPPLTTAKMQQVMASKFGMDGEQTMQAAQSLYEFGHCTYIRTDSVRVSESAIDSVRQWLLNNNFEIPNKANIFKNKSSTQDAHECIRPTNIDLLPEKLNLSDDCVNLYKMIWLHFIASQMVPAMYDTLEVKIIHLPSKLKFKISGKHLTTPGYLSLIGSKDEGASDLPLLEENELLRLIDNNSVTLEQKFTQPPPRYNYASLVKELENKGIGRPSTYTAIIGKITNRNYVIKKGNSYESTELGSKITELLTKYFDFMEYDYTAQLEAHLDDIAEGKVDKLKVLTDFYVIFSDKLKKAHVESGGILCNKCQSPMHIKLNSSQAKFLGCSQYPHCVNAMPIGPTNIKKCA